MAEYRIVGVFCVLLVYIRDYGRDSSATRGPFVNSCHNRNIVIINLLHNPEVKLLFVFVTAYFVFILWTSQFTYILANTHTQPASVPNVLHL